MQEVLTHYVKAIAKMRTASGKQNYPEATNHRAPHKPLLLLSIFDLYDEGELTTNFIPLSPELIDLFATYWQLVMPSDRNVRIFLPYFHMKNDGFWHLIPKPDKEVALEVIKQIAGMGQLREIVLGAKFDDALFELVIVKETRQALRQTIIETYFSQSIQSTLSEQSDVNVIVHQYSQALLDQARNRVNRTEVNQDLSQKPVRDQGFRKAIVKAYDHRCVLCGVRLLTDGGLTVATAAHIIPWSVSYNDDPRNGLCLCRLCHWAFDVGLASITTKYRVKLSKQLNAGENIPGHLSTLDSRPIFEPVEDSFNPDVEALEWHLNQIFLKS